MHLAGHRSGNEALQVRMTGKTTFPANAGADVDRPRNQYNEPKSLMSNNTLSILT
jgi:hypothetical protein